MIQQSFKKQKAVVLSSNESEYRAFRQVIIEIAWLKSLFNKLKVDWLGPVVIWCDNVSVASLAANSVFQGRTKHIKLDVHYIREQVVAKSVVIQYVYSQLQDTDVLTKALFTMHFELLQDKLQVVNGKTDEIRESLVEVSFNITDAVEKYLFAVRVVQTRRQYVEKKKVKFKGEVREVKTACVIFTF